MNLVTFTGTILELNRLLDTGLYDAISVEEVLSSIEDGSILEFIKLRAPDSELAFFLSGNEHFYVAYLQSLRDTYGHGRRKWMVENRGLCLLIAWTNEIVQQGSGWSPNPDVVDQ